MTFDQLFDRWQNTFHFDAFVKDGIVNESKYEKPHILFVLRDKYDCETCDFRQTLQENGEGWKTWNNVTRWVTGILDKSPYNDSISTDSRTSELQRVSIMNLKKECGGNRSNGKVLKKHVEDQYEFILEEILLCSPNIILACGLPTHSIESSATLLKNIVFKELETSDYETIASINLNRNWRFFNVEIQNVTIPVIEFCHPQVTYFKGFRGHALWKYLHEDILKISTYFLKDSH